MKKIIRILAVFAVLAVLPPSPSLYGKGWESSRTEKSTTRLVGKNSEIEVRSGKGLIQVTASRPVTIKVYSILGQLISQETLPAGTSYYIVNSHGIFIIKVGDLTCKVSL